MDRTLLKPFIARESYTEFQQHLASQPLLCDHRTLVKVICYEKYFHMTTLPISQSASHVTCSRSSSDQHFCACTMWRTIVRTRSCTLCKNMAGFLVKSVQFPLASSHFPRAGSSSNSGVPPGAPGSGRASDRRRKMREHAVESARTLAGTFFSRFLS